MTEACAKLYGEAGEPMRKFYGVFELAMLKTGEHAGNWHLPRPDKVYTPAMEAEADQWLAKAEKAATEEMARKRIAAEKALWLAARSVLAKLREAEEAQTFTVALDGKKMTWKKPTVTRAIIISLYGLPDDVKIEVVEKDGQTRRLEDKDNIDLTQGATFKSFQ
jgi:hypothetical protein